MLRKILLVCGILASVLWIGMDIYAATQYEGYDYLGQAGSELSAVGAPTRSMLMRSGFIYEFLTLAFGLGVWISAGQKRPLRITGGLLIAFAIVGFLWALAPMHARGAERTFADTMHIVLSGWTILAMFLMTGFGASASGPWFRRYSIVTLVTAFVGFALTGIEAPKVAANQPTPWLGLYERAGIYAFMIWVVVLAIVLLRAQETREIVAEGRETGFPLAGGAAGDPARVE